MYACINAQYAEGIAHCEEALRVAAATGDLELRILGTPFPGVINNALGNNRVATELLRRVLEGPGLSPGQRALGLSLGSVYVGSCGWR